MADRSHFTIARKLFTIARSLYTFARSLYTIEFSREFRSVEPLLWHDERHSGRPEPFLSRLRLSLYSCNMPFFTCTPYTHST